MSITNKAGSIISSITGNKPLRLLLIAMGLAALAAFLTMKYLDLREAELQRAYLRSDEQTIRVIVPKDDLPAGTIISGNTVAARDVPGIYVQKTSVRPGEFESVKGRRIIADVKKGTPLLWEHIAGSKRSDFSDVLENGRRAITVQVDQINSINGMIEPGNEIDLFVTLDAKYIGGKEGDAIFPVIQKVEVLATGRRLEPEVQASMNVAYERRRGDSFNTITIDVTPREAALILTAESTGTLSALLRNREDNSVAKFGHISPDQLFTIAQRIAKEKSSVNKIPPQIVRDEQGNIIGVDDGKGNLLDPTTGKVIAKKNVDGSYVTDDGKNLGTASTEKLTEAEALKLGLPSPSETITTGNDSEQIPEWLVEYLAGGNSKDGIAIVQKIPVQ